MPDFTDDFDSPTVTLSDEAGRTLDCFIEQTLTVDGEDYLLLLPVDAPIEVFVWQSEDDDDEELLADIDEGDIDELFPTAKAVLAELDLTLQRSAHTLTAAGELPEIQEENCFSLEVPSDDASESTVDEFQMLATFFHEDEQYTLCTPLEPLLFFAKRDRNGQTVLLSPEEFQRIQPQLEDQLFDVLE
ncbi:MAG: DUF3727 domain-containing protein [Leptolyngbya sp. SIO4C1]|nr:DUF3727 domain-containing protein [Leptolyngbya sp. SIO4C1]